MNITKEQMYKTLRPARSKKKIVIIAVLVLAAAAIAAYMMIFKDKGPVYDFITADAATGSVVSVVSATGKISATNEVLIGSQVSGTISAVFVEENDVVKKGDILAIINPDTINQTIARYEAQLNSTKASLNASEVSYNNKKTNYDRLSQVYKATNGKSPSKNDLDNARMELLTAQAEIKVRKAAVAEAETSLNSAKIDLKNSIITSPIDGIVLTRSIDAGQTVAASFSTPELFVIAENLEKMKLMVNVSEADVGKVKEGQRVTFTVDAFPDTAFTSSIYRVNKGSTTSSDNIVSYETTIYIDNENMMLRSGMSATADIETAAAENAILIPVSAVFFKPPVIKESSEVEKRPQMLQGPPGRPRRQTQETTEEIVSKNAVIHILSGGKAEARNAELGVSDGKNIQVISGISSGEKVITGVKMRK